MVEIFRSVAWATQAEEKDAYENLLKLRADRFLSVGVTNATILEFFQSFQVKFGAAPALRSLRDYADDLKSPEVTKAVDVIELGNFYKGPDFEELVEREVRDQGVTELTVVCKETINLITSGKKTVGEAVGHLFTKVRVPPEKNSDKLPADLGKARSQLEVIYQERKKNPNHSYGIMSGYGVFDQSSSGVKKKELYIHAGFPGHLKSTVIMNMAVNSAVDYGWNPMIFSAEMPMSSVMFCLVAIHSANKKFNGVGKPLSKIKLLLGQLAPHEEDFYRVVFDDLLNNSDHGKIRVVDSGEFSTFGSIVQRVNRESQETEVDMVWIDYLTRLPVDAKYAKMSITEARNETIVDAKQFAMSFNGGKGIAVGTGFQINRESFKRVKEKVKENPKGPIYDKTCLGQYNAAEKEADFATYSWFDDAEKINSEPRIGILKSRWGEEKPEPYSLYCCRDSRRLHDMSQGLRIMSTPTQSEGGVNAGVEL